ncbi:MAG: DedA family protein [Myxococcales bacterium]|nr:DedA family protein [Myxococcales bacterium]
MTTGTELSPDVAALPAKRPPLHRRLYNWVLAWADSKHAGWALFLIAFAESSFFPVPPDVLLIALVLGSHREAWRFAGICLAGSVLGGVAGYGIGMGFWEATQAYFFKIPGLTPAAFDKMAERYESWGIAIVFLAAFTPIPYKLITISAGVFKVSFLPFLAGSVVGRGGRFFLVAGLLYFYGPRIRPYIDKHFEKLALLFGALMVGGFVALKYLR